MENVMSLYRSCQLCPRHCGIDRLAGKKGYCGSNAVLYVAHSMLHMWEEPFLSGKNGSGAVFFSGCPLGCVYCQNRKISGGSMGDPYTIEQLAALFLSLQEKGAHNINLVTATHYAPHLVQALSIAKEQGLSLPIILNTSGYEAPQTLAMLEKYVDIYLTDYRYVLSGTARKYSSAEDYPTVMDKSLRAMMMQKPKLLMDENGLLREGVVVRLLLLPGHLIEAKMILHKIYHQYGDALSVSLMRQYTPMPGIEKSFPELGRGVTDAEYVSLVSYAQSLGVKHAFTQESGSVSESFIPAF